MSCVRNQASTMVCSCLMSVVYWLPQRFEKLSSIDSSDCSDKACCLTCVPYYVAFYCILHAKVSALHSCSCPGIETPQCKMLLHVLSLLRQCTILLLCPQSHVTMRTSILKQVAFCNATIYHGPQLQLRLLLQ